jgi:hypothetical protein
MVGGIGRRSSAAILREAHAALACAAETIPARKQFGLAG